MDKAILIASIMLSFKIDVGMITFSDISVRVNQEQTLLPFPFLVTTLCDKAGAPPITLYDHKLKAIQDINITISLTSTGTPSTTLESALAN